ncbi:hypothetical protein [Microbulbifer sp. 2201CG32-9]|uniref:hypothetical protein n=1 Tax=unclassified Microbulbifer TaxID=2619833 RepID=UPI00345BB248
MSKLIRPIVAPVFLLLVCAVFPTVSKAQEITVEHYIAMDLLARQATLDGVRQRLNLLQSRADRPEQLAQDSKTRQSVEAIYADFGTTSAQAVAWATRNRQAINHWLDGNPGLQAEYARIARELEQVSARIQALASQ